ncbi:hypothetical protein MtrunA17_Chr2g0292221 [Medicago truncatula]|uniref:Transmembrane protein n=1 Tax=Medicago truncatula TaxID=3880 RepID=A0A396J4J3_MEDTR|nr:hypothetical protein MtrunA17_Chr2g0292221 [Medicago truncatula]
MCYISLKKKKNGMCYIVIRRLVNNLFLFGTSFFFYVKYSLYSFLWDLVTKITSINKTCWNNKFVTNMYDYY